MSTARPIAGWYRDPSGQFALRYWDGDAWTARVRRDADGLRHAAVATPAPATGLTRSRAGTRRAESTRWPVAIWTVLAAGVALMVVGALLPWREAQVGNESFSTNGIDGDGALAVMLAVTVVILLVLLERSRRLAVFLIGLGVVGVGFALFEIVDVSREADELGAGEAARGITANVGSGPWVVLVGGILILAGAVLALARWPRAGNRDHRRS
jgi:Protein of unknown function (DUF2510)